MSTAPKAPAASRYTPPSVVGDQATLTDKQARLLAIASDLGRNRFAARAAQIDRDAVFPFENYSDMASAGLLRICVPERYGGWGADFATYAMVSAEIGRHCGATALTLDVASAAGASALDHVVRLHRRRPWEDSRATRQP